MNKKLTFLLHLMITLFTMIIVILIPYLIYNEFYKGCCGCGDTEGNHCCPCVNEDLIDIVENHTGQRASSAGSWYEMCKKYKDDTNDTRECFE